jgi:hypothetical protein
MTKPTGELPWPNAESQRISREQRGPGLFYESSQLGPITHIDHSDGSAFRRRSSYMESRIFGSLWDEK